MPQGQLLEMLEIRGKVPWQLPVDADDAVRRQCGDEIDTRFSSIYASGVQCHESSLNHFPLHYKDMECDAVRYIRCAKAAIAAVALAALTGCAALQPGADQAVAIDAIVGEALNI